MSEAIAHNLLDFLASRSISLLHTFISDGFRNEVNTMTVKDYVHNSLPTLRWVAPRIVPGTRQMEHFLWDSTVSLIANRWGIQEPDPAVSHRISPTLLDAILVPLLAYDRVGNRAGYGGGYYDRFLAECNPDALKVGLSFFDPIDLVSDSGAWDIILDYCITPTSIYGPMP